MLPEGTTGMVMMKNTNDELENYRLNFSSRMHKLGSSSFNRETIDNYLITKLWRIITHVHAVYLCLCALNPPSNVHYLRWHLFSGICIPTYWRLFLITSLRISEPSVSCKIVSIFYFVRPLYRILFSLHPQHQLRLKLVPSCLSRGSCNTRWMMIWGALYNFPSSGAIAFRWQPESVYKRPITPLISCLNQGGAPGDEAGTGLTLKVTWRVTDH